MSTQEELLREIAAQAADRGLERPIPRLTAYLVRWALDVSLPLDVLAIEKLADHHAMQILAKCRVTAPTPAVWRELRANLPSVWRILMDERRAA